MKIVILHSELGVLRGGGENFTRNLFTAFAKRGHQVSAVFVADIHGRYPLSLPSAIEPIPIRGWWSRNCGGTLLSTIGRQIPLKSRLSKHWSRFQRAISWRVINWHNERFQRRVERELASSWNNFDSAYVHSDPVLASKVADFIPTVLRLAGPVSADSLSSLQKVHAVCANGDALLQLRRFLAAAIELPVGLDTQRFTPGRTALRQRLNWSNDEVVIGYVGRLTPIKGVDILATAFIDVSKTMPDLRLLIVGHGEAEAAIRSTLTRQLEKGVVHIERDVTHDQLPEYYRAMDLFVLPSRYENHSNALLESMACGVPFVASDVGGNSLLRNAGCGWLFECESAASLAHCLATVLENKLQLKVHGEIASKYVQRYSWTNSAERLEEIFSRLRVDG
jgi:glycosyltransferase involved in cell wall biosynthesis